MPPETATTNTANATSAKTLQAFQAQATSHAQALGKNVASTYLSHLGMLEFFGLVIAIIFCVGIIYFVIETGWFSLRVHRFRHIILQSNIPKKEAQEAWHRIEEQFYRGGENDLKVAVLEADKLLNDALREAGIMGIQLGDRLKKTTAEQIPNLNDLWQAHKLRNQIAHEQNFKLKRDVAERALHIYEKTFKNLGIFEGMKEK